MMSSRKAISVINSIKVPKHMVREAIAVRNNYVDYFKRQPGFVSSTFYQAAEDSQSSFDFVNIVVWESKEHFDAVVNDGFRNSDGMNRDGRKVLGKGFPEPIQVSPGQYVVVENDLAEGSSRDQL